MFTDGKREHMSWMKWEGLREVSVNVREFCTPAQDVPDLYLHWLMFQFVEKEMAHSFGVRSRVCKDGDAWVLPVTLVNVMAV